MEPYGDILQAMAYCPFKAWQISKQAGCDLELLSTGETPIKSSKKAEKLLTEAKKILDNPDPPPFYKNKHCPECQFKESCYKKLKEKDCISLLGSISPKIVAKYHSKGIFSITQLSHLF